MPRPARPWFRTYSETLENEKAHALGTERPDLFFRWCQLQCLANITQPRGYLPHDAIKIAFAMRVTIEESSQILTELKARRFLDLRGKRFYMHDWHEWNPDSDANLTKARATRNKRTGKERAKNGERTHKERIDSDKEVEVDQEKDAEAETDRVKPRLPLPKVFNNLTGRAITPMEAELLKALEEEHPYDRIVYAIEQAAAAGARNLAYIKKVCESQETNGDRHERPSTGTNGRTPASVGATAEQARTLERLGIEKRWNLD